MTTLPPSYTEMTTLSTPYKEHNCPIPIIHVDNFNPDPIQEENDSWAISDVQVMTISAEHRSCSYTLRYEDKRITKTHICNGTQNNP